MPPAKILPKNVLYELYVVKKLSSNDIARMLGVSKSTVLRYLDKYDIQKRHKSGSIRKYDRYAEEWKKLYEKGYSLHEIAKIYGTTPMTVSSVLLRANVKIRSISEGTSLAKWKRSKIPSKDVLQKLYIENGKNSREIAEIFGVSQGTVLKWLKKYEIPIRSNSEAQLLRLGIKVKRKLKIKVRRLIIEDMLINYVIHNKDKFGYKEVYIFRNKNFDLLCITNKGEIKRVEIERIATEFIDHKHNPKKVDEIIAFTKGDEKKLSKIKVPIKLIDKSNFIKFVEKILKYKERVTRLQG